MSNPERHIPESDIQPEEEKELVYLDEDWFDSYLEGNLRIPQTGIGLRLYAISALLEGRDPDMERFMSSQLSPTQLERSKFAMNQAHRSKQIHAGTEDVIPEMMENIRNHHPNAELDSEAFAVIDDERLQKLWQVIKENSRNALSRWAESSGVKLNPELKFGPFENQARDNARAKELLQNPKYEIFLEELKKILKVAKETLMTPEGLKLTKEYRDSFSRREEPNKKMPPERSWDDDGYGRKLELLVDQHIKETGVSLDPMDLRNFWQFFGGE